MKFKQLVENIENQEDKIFYPNGVYISLKISELSQRMIQEWQEKYLKFADNEVNKELHCTLIHSKQEHKEEIKPESYSLSATVIGYDKFGNNNECLVAKLKSEQLLFRNKELVQKYNFISDFDEYQPHITLSYNAQDVDINSLPIMDFAIELENETVEQLDTNWNDKKEKNDNK